MKTNRVMLVAAMLAGTIGVSAAMAEALDRDADDRRADIEPQRYGPGTDTIPDDFPRPTERDYARIAQAEERRAARRARNLRNI